MCSRARQSPASLLITLPSQVTLVTREPLDSWVAALGLCGDVLGLSLSCRLLAGVSLGLSGVPHRQAQPRSAGDASGLGGRASFLGQDGGGIEKPDDGGPAAARLALLLNTRSVTHVPVGPPANLPPSSLGVPPKAIS